MKIRRSFSIDDETYQKFELIARTGYRSPNNLIAYIIRRTVAVYEAAGWLRLLTGERLPPR